MPGGLGGPQRIATMQPAHDARVQVAPEIDERRGRAAGVDSGVQRDAAPDVDLLLVQRGVDFQVSP